MKESYLLYKEKLTGEYRETFEKIEIYVKARGADEPVMEERLLQITDVLLAAQSEGTPWERVVGKDIEKFCRTFCSDIGVKNKIWRVLDSLKLVVIIELIDVFFGFLGLDFSKVGFFQVKSESGILNLVAAFALSIILCEITGFAISSLMFRVKKLNAHVFKWIWYGVAAISVAFAFWLVIMEPFGALSVPLWAVGAVCLVFLSAYAILNIDRKKRDTRKKVSMSDDLEAGFAAEMEKIYESKNRRRIKKGRGPLSMAEFVDMQERECEKAYKSKIFYFILPLIICPVAIIFAECESLFDGVMFAVIQFAVQYALMYGFWRLIKNSADMRERWVAAQRKKLNTEENKNNI
ncbi:MAG: hypothetical protein IJ046_02210 [Clostridia bacterium]|nr:hypothetical protein [Clostridia bacterium]